ncbi:MAG: hypothetical protein AAF039_02710 [Bacteroidota bacterium]
MKNKRFKGLAYSSGILLWVMGAFHGSGLLFITELVNASNLSDGIKSIFPVLFILPSIEMIGLGVLCFLAPTLDGQRAYLVYYVVCFLVVINAFLAFYLKAWIPGVILLIPSILVFVIAFRLKKSQDS